MYEQWSYLGIFVLLVAASFGIPIPEDIPLLAGGYLCYLGEASMPVMIAVGITGVLTGDIVLFIMGRRFGHHIVKHRFIRRLVKPARLLAAERLFAHHGVKILFFGRFLPGLRAMLFMAAGVLRVKPVVFVVVDGSAALLSVTLLVVLGTFFGGSLERIKHDLRLATHTVAVVAIVSAVIASAVWMRRRQKRLMAEEPVPDVDMDQLAEIPPVGQYDLPPAKREKHQERLDAHGPAVREHR